MYTLIDSEQVPELLTYFVRLHCSQHKEDVEKNRLSKTKCREKRERKYKNLRRLHFKFTLANVRDFDNENIYRNQNE